VVTSYSSCFRHQAYGGVCGQPSGESSHCSWLAGDAGPPALLRHRSCSHLTHAALRCAHCGEPLHSRDIDVEPGPGAVPA
jgi:hypothetical protein